MRLNKEYTCEGCSSLCYSDPITFALENRAKGEVLTYNKDTNSLVFLVKGRIRIHGHDIHDFISDKNHIVLLIEHASYKIEILDDSELLLLPFVRSYQVCDQISLDKFRYMTSGYRYTFHALRVHKYMRQLINTTAQYLRDGIECEHVHHAMQLELFIISRFYYKTKTMYEFYYPVIDRKIHIQSLVKKYVHQAKNVEELALLCGYTVSTFNKVFVEIFRLSPYQWMQQQKAKKVRAQLLDKQIPIKAVAATHGFSCQSHLNKFCKRYLGGTSKQVRDANDASIQQEAICKNIPNK